MPVIQPATYDVDLSHYGTNRAQRAVLGIASPLPTGKTLIKRAGRWYCTILPTEDELEAADYYFLGGHRHVISDALLAEIQAAVGADCQPTVSIGLYPSSTTYPSASTIPGAG